MVFYFPIFSKIVVFRVELYIKKSNSLNDYLVPEMILNISPLAMIDSNFPFKDKLSLRIW